MKRSTAAIVTLAVGVSLGAGTGIGLALWSDDESVPLQLRGGYVHYAVGTAHVPAAIHTDSATFTKADGTPGWQLPDHVLRDLEPGQPQTAVVQIDGYSQGNRGLEYWLASLDVEGDPGLIDAANLRIVDINHPDECDAGQLPRSRTGDRYNGPSAGAAFGHRELVHPRQFNEVDGYGTWETHSVTNYLCLELSLPEEAPEYTNTVTATGTGQEGSAEATVTATHDWTAVLEPTAEQRAAKVTFTFPYATYRPGGAEGAGSSGQTP